MPPLVPSPAPASALLPISTSRHRIRRRCRVSVAIGIRARAARPVGHLLPEALQVGPGNRLPRSRQTPVQQGLLTPAEGFAQLRSVRLNSSGRIRTQPVSAAVYAVLARRLEQAPDDAT